MADADSTLAKLERAAATVDAAGDGNMAQALRSIIGGADPAEALQLGTLRAEKIAERDQLIRHALARFGGTYDDLARAFGDYETTAWLREKRDAGCPDRWRDTAQAIFWRVLKLGERISKRKVERAMQARHGGYGNGGCTYPKVVE
jgi:hypothetical protein